MELIVCFCNYGSHLPKRVEMVICGYNQGYDNSLVRNEETMDNAQC